MTSVVFRADIYRTIPHISTAVESQPADNKAKDAKMAKYAHLNDITNNESKPAAKKAPTAINVISNYFSK